MLYAFFWVIPRHLNFICRCFRILCLFHLPRRVGMKCDWVENVVVFIREIVWLKNSLSHLAQAIFEPGNYPKESIQQYTVFSPKAWTIMLQCTNALHTWKSNESLPFHSSCHKPVNYPLLAMVIQMSKNGHQVNLFDPVGKILHKQHL